MNCRRVQKLIPLYVEGDLGSGTTNRIASHLEWCGRCNWLADEYRESQSWLRSCEPPEFDAASLGALKSAVLRRAQEINSTHSTLASIMQHWSSKQTLAFSAALLIVLGMLVFYVYQATLSKNTKVPRTAHETAREGSNAPEQQIVSPAEQAPEAGFKAGRHSPKRQRSSRVLVESSTVARQALSTPPESQRNWTTTRWDTVTDHIPAIFEGATESKHMLRIEIQTSDPNIRIIWFAPRETDWHQNKPATD